MKRRTVVLTAAEVERASAALLVVHELLADVAAVWCRVAVPDDQESPAPRGKHKQRKTTT